MLLCQWLVSNHVEVEVAQGQSEGSKEVAHQVAYLLVLRSFISRDDVEDHGEHGDEDGEENQEYLQINHDTDDHSHDVTEVSEYFHKEQRLYQRGQNHNNQNNLRPNVPRAIFANLENNAQVSKEDVAYVDIVLAKHKVVRSLFDQLSSVVVHWVQQANSQSYHVIFFTPREDSIVDLFACLG